MKIAQVAPLIESVPPRLYGGTERIVSYLTEELVRLGHDVTLFASADSITSAELAPGVTGKIVGSEEEAVAALPAILAYDRREVRQRFEDRFTATRMAQDYVSTYRQSMKTRTASTRPRRLALNGGNGLAPISIEKPFVALFKAGTDPEISYLRNGELCQPKSAS